MGWCARGARWVRQLLEGIAVIALVCTATGVIAGAPEDSMELLRRADSIKTRNPEEFLSILASLEARAARLPREQQEYLRYFKAWKTLNEGKEQAALPSLEQLVQNASDPTLRFRARSTLMNLREVLQHYESAYSQLNRLLEELPRVADPAAREQALMNAAQLYRRVGETDLSLAYAQRVIDENWAQRGVCRGGQQKLATLYESGRLKTVGTEVQAGIDACEKQGEVAYANEIRTHAAKLYIEQNRLDEAIALLKAHYEETLRTRYPELIAQFDALLADAYRRKGYPARAHDFATRALHRGFDSPFHEPVVIATRILYELAKDQGNFKLALAFHEQYAIADKGYTDDNNARQLAYGKVVDEAVANKLEIAALTKQNQVLKLQKALAAEALKTSRLYAILLITALAFIGLWAYRTKRSQLHFMNLSRLDGLTGICNRQHFISQAEAALKRARESQHELCIVLCDLDHFKAINDRHGHATGDSVLRDTVAKCSHHLHPREVFGRFGGEEFGLLLPASTPDTALLRAEELRAAIAAMTVGFGSGEFKVSASFGIAATSVSGYGLRQLLADADAALYQAKAAGRNRVVLHNTRRQWREQLGR
jgi:diguanylate cyclase (GGDEF)-like protein